MIPLFWANGAAVDVAFGAAPPKLNVEDGCCGVPNAGGATA